MVMATGRLTFGVVCVHAFLQHRDKGFNVRAMNTDFSPRNHVWVEDLHCQGPIEMLPNLGA
eukprot:15445316-Alexandrium_andersonii.AAC.1